jgi:hypothetical protein
MLLPKLLQSLMHVQMHRLSRAAVATQNGGTR